MNAKQSWFIWKTRGWIQLKMLILQPRTSLYVQIEKIVNV